MAAGPGGYAPDGSVPAAAQPLWRRGNVRVITAIVVAVLAVLGFVVRHVTATSPKGSVTLPGTLLGVSKDTSSAARAVDRELVRKLPAAGGTVNPVAGLYGSLSGRAFAVAGGGLCGSCAPKSAAAILRIDRKTFPGVRLFPPGPDGGVLDCAPGPGQVAAFYCRWTDGGWPGAVAHRAGLAGRPGRRARCHARQHRLSGITRTSATITDSTPDVLAANIAHGENPKEPPPAPPATRDFFGIGATPYTTGTQCDHEVSPARTARATRRGRRIGGRRRS